MKKIETGCQDKLDWFDGKHINEILFCQEFLKTHPMRCIGGTLFTVDGPVESEELVKRQIIDMIQSCITTNLSKRASSLLESLKIQAYRDSMNTRLDAQQSGNAHYVATSHEAGTIDYKRTDLFISGEYFVHIRSDAHYGILSIACGARDADESNTRGAVGMSIVDKTHEGTLGWRIRDDELRSVLEARGLSYDAFCSNDAAFNLSEEELADLTRQVVSAITYGDIVSYPLKGDTSFTYTLDGHPYEDDADMDEWVVFYSHGSDMGSLGDSYSLDGSIDGTRMFVDAQPTSVVEQ